MGLEILLPVLFKVGPYLLGVVALVGAYFGVKLKGKREAEATVFVEAQKSRQKAQDALDSARDQDRQVDVQTRKKIENLPKSSVPNKDSIPKIGDVFKFGIVALLILGCAACATLPAVSQPKVDIPSKPVLADCPSVPHPDGVVIQDAETKQAMVLLSVPNAMLLREYLATAFPCYEANRIQLEGWAEKLVNRLKALRGEK